MIDYLGNLLRRTFIPVECVRPRLPALFEIPSSSFARWIPQVEDLDDNQAYNRELSVNQSDFSSLSESEETLLRLPEEKKSDPERSSERVTEPATAPSLHLTKSPRASQAATPPITGKPRAVSKVEQDPDQSVSNALPRRVTASAADSEEKALSRSRGIKVSEVETPPPLSKRSPPKKRQKSRSISREQPSRRARMRESTIDSTVSVSDRSKTNRVSELESKKSGDEDLRERPVVVAPQNEVKTEIPVIPTALRKRRGKPQVVIGRIKVEVVQEPPKPEPVKVITVSPTDGNSRSKRSGTTRSNLRFGLGQM